MVGQCSMFNVQCSMFNVQCVPVRVGGMGGKCVEIDAFPNATVAEYGGYSMFSFNKPHKIKAEIFARGKQARVFILLSQTHLIRFDSFTTIHVLYSPRQDLLPPVSMLNRSWITRAVS
jgi:hypothetical protein